MNRDATSPCAMSSTSMPRIGEGAGSFETGNARHEHEGERAEINASL
jgi:hypothetical protein